MTIAGYDLVPGERQLGQYTISILQPTQAGWEPSMMALNAVVSNYRLMLRPLRKKYAPASIPCAYIDKTEVVLRGNYHCIALTLATKHRLYFLSSTGSLDDLYDDLSVMKLPPPRFRFDDRVARQDIERLVSFLRVDYSLE